MSDIGAFVEMLVESGAPPALAARVVAEAFAAGVRSAEFRGIPVDETAERRRAKDRDRKRLIRGNPQTSADIPRNSKTPLTLPSLTTSELVIQKEKKVRARKAPAGPLSAEFQPNEKHFEAADKLGIPRQSVFDKCEDMRIWAASSGAVKADWSATLHGFLRRDAEKLKSNKPTVHDAARNQTNRAMEYLRQLDEPGGTRGAGDAAGGSPLRLLSSR